MQEHRLRLVDSKLSLGPLATNTGGGIAKSHHRPGFGRCWDPLLN